MSVFTPEELPKLKLLAEQSSEMYDFHTKQAQVYKENLDDLQALITKLAQK